MTIGQDSHEGLSFSFVFCGYNKNMKNEWKPYHHRIRCSSQAVHLDTDEELKRFLRSSGRALNSIEQEIRTQFKEQYRRDIKIKGSSLRTEILMHVYADTVFLKLLRLNEKLPGPVSSRLAVPLKKLQHATEVIDIGERFNDSNRFVFDWLSMAEPLLTSVFRHLV